MFAKKRANITKFGAVPSREQSVSLRAACFAHGVAPVLRGVIVYSGLPQVRR